jgi:sugar phosphate isomerase/epimerase
MIGRRNLLKTGAGALSAALLPMSGAVAAPRQRWGLQLFTVGALLERDLPGTLKQVASIGYREVETVGSFGRDPAMLRGLFDRYRLKSPSQHLASDELYASFGAWTRREITTEANRANYERLLAPANAIALVRDGIGKAKVLGQQYVTWPILMPKMLADAQIIRTYIGLFNEAGRICREEGLKFAYHHHDREFAPFPGDTRSIYDVIVAETDPALVHLELDIYWATKAGHDPVQMVGRLGSRVFGCHVKNIDAADDFAPLTKGRIDIPAFITAARGAGVRHFFVEYDRADDPMAVVRDAYGVLARLK